MRQNNYRATAYLSDVRRGNIGGRERPAFGTFAFFFLLYLHLISRIISMAKCTRDGQRVKLHSKTSGRRYTDSDTDYSYRCRYRYIYTACCRYTFVLAETARAVLCAFLCFVHS